MPSGASSRLIVQNKSILTPIEAVGSNTSDPHIKKHSTANDVMHGLSSMLTGKAYHDDTHKARFSSLSQVASGVSRHPSEDDSNNLNAHTRNVSTLSNDPSSHNAKRSHPKNKSHGQGHHGFKNIQKIKDGKEASHDDNHHNRRKSKKRKNEKEMASKDIALIMSFGK